MGKKLNKDQLTLSFRTILVNGDVMDGYGNTC